MHTLLGGPGRSSIRFGASMFYEPVQEGHCRSLQIRTAASASPPPSRQNRAPTALQRRRAPGLDKLSSVPPLTTPPKVGYPATPGSEGILGFLVDSHLRTPYSTTLNFSISRDLPAGFTIETAYAGRIGRKLLLQADLAAPLINFKDTKSGQTWIEAAGIIADLFDRQAPLSQVPRIPFFENIFAPMASNGATASQAAYATMLESAPSWTDALHDLDSSGKSIYGPFTFFQQQFNWLPTWTNLGQSSYHSFQFAVRKRFSGGLQADVNYTLAKALDNGSSVESEGQGAGQLLNAFDHRQGLSFSNFDIRHQINSNFVLDLPVGRDRHFAANMPPVLESILGGWRLAGLVRWRTGFPFASSAGNGLNFPTNFYVNGPPTLKPGASLPKVQVTKNASGGPNIFADAEKAYNSFQATRSGFSGDRNVFHGPGFFTIDSSVQKAFKLGEQRELQFRWETFNVTNTANFDGRVYPIGAFGNRGISFDLDNKSSFGLLRTLAGDPRIMQFALRYQF